MSTSRTLRLRQDGKSRCAREAAAVLHSGGLIVSPTDTIYGLLCAFSSQEAVERLYGVKGRDQEKRLIALVPDLECAAALSARRLPDFAARFWPGPLTIILPASANHPLGWKTQAVRVPDDPWIRALLREVGGPVFAPSANPQGLPPATSVEKAGEYFKEDVELYIDGGSCPEDTKPSTLVGWKDGQWILLREGAIPAAQLQDGLM